MNHLCSECGLQIFKQSYKEHLALHKEEKIICDLCGKMFCTTGRLKGHQITMGRRYTLVINAIKYLEKNITWADTADVKTVRPKMFTKSKNKENNVFKDALGVCWPYK